MTDLDATIAELAYGVAVVELTAEQIEIIAALDDNDPNEVLDLTE